MMRRRRPPVPVGQGRAAPRLVGRIVLCTTLLAAMVLIGWLTWTGDRLRTEARVAARHAIRVAELRGTIVSLDEWMAASARLEVATGERRWRERYEDAAPRLDAALAEAADLAPASARAALASTAGEAHRDLVTMERRAMVLAQTGDLAAARALLDGPEFSYLEDVYAAGVDVFGQDLASVTDGRVDSLTDRAWLEAFGAALAIVVLVAAALSVRGRARLGRALARVTAVAGTDAVTQLPNRRGFLDAAEAMVGAPDEETKPRALLLIDLDRFKAVNDVHGHTAGDEVLRLAATRLRGAVRDGDLVARVGGDEFAVLLDPTPKDERTGREPEAVAARLLGVFADPFVLADGSAVAVGASVGLAPTDPGCTAVSDLVQRAELALAQAKGDGRGCVRVFAPGMDAAARARALLESDLRQAVAAGAIVPHYQPLVDLSTNETVAVEMLARWSHPGRGSVPPDTFIPLAEETGLIAALTDRLLRRACHELAGWPDLTLAVNLSPVQLRDPALPEAIAQALAETGFPAARLELEVTESALVGDLELARGLLGQLKGVGVRLALDDFGTGYSSLRHLQALPFDKIKIDRSFVAAMADDPESAKIVEAVVGLGHSLGLATVAEGIETEAVAARLRALGCAVGQGWLFGRPVPVERLAAHLGAAGRHASEREAA